MADTAATAAATPSSPLDFSERLSRKVLASLKSLNESLGEVRASVAKIDSIAHARLQGGQGASAGSPRTPAAAASSGSTEGAGAAAAGSAADENAPVRARLAFGVAGAGATLPPPPPPVPHAAGGGSGGAGLGVPPGPPTSSDAAGAADVTLLKRLLLAPALKGAGLDEGLLAELRTVLTPEEAAAVEEHVAMRLSHSHGHGASHGHGVGHGSLATPSSGGKTTARTHTPPPADWHPPTPSTGRKSAVAWAPTTPKDDDEDEEEGEGTTGKGKAAASEELEEDDDLAALASAPAAGKAPPAVQLKLISRPRPAPPSGPDATAPKRWFTFPRYKPQPGAEPGAVADDGSDSIPFVTQMVPEAEFQELLAKGAAGMGVAAEVAAEEAAALAAGGGPLPGEHVTPPAGPADAYTIADPCPSPTVHEWEGGDVEWPTAPDAGAEDSSPTGGAGKGSAGRPKVFEAFALRVVYEAGRTGFEDAKDFTAAAGELVAGRYRVNSFLGSAAFSSALSCTDMVTGEDVALKVIKNNKDFVDQSLDEIKLLRYLNAQGDPDEHRVLRLRDFFYHKEHLFLVTELLKDNLYEWQTYVEGHGMEPYFSLPRVQRIARQTLQALAFIHSHGLIHCDLKPENLLIVSYSRCDVKVIDFGSSCFITDRLSTYIQSRSYRAPEVVLGLPYGPKIDVWSLGCILTELLTGKVLFPNESVQTMLVRMQSLLGPFPSHMVALGSDSSKYLTPQGTVYEAATGGENGDPEEEEVPPGAMNLMYPTPTSLAVRSGSDDPLWLDFIACLLQVDPAKRPTAAQALAHPWLADPANTLPFAPYVMHVA